MRHQHISFVKSGVRFLGYAFIPLHLGLAAVILILAEILGITEEIGHD